MMMEARLNNVVVRSGKVEVRAEFSGRGLSIIVTRNGKVEFCWDNIFVNNSFFFYCGMRFGGGRNFLWRGFIL